MVAMDREDRDANVEVRVFVVDMAKPAGRGRGSLDVRRNSSYYTKLCLRQNRCLQISTRLDGSLGEAPGGSPWGKIFGMSSPSSSSRQHRSSTAFFGQLFYWKTQAKMQVKFLA